MYLSMKTTTFYHEAKAALWSEGREDKPGLGGRAEVKSVESRII